VDSYAYNDTYVHTHDHTYANRDFHTYSDAHAD
jgi:hypothetical protein